MQRASESLSGPAVFGIWKLIVVRCRGQRPRLVELGEHFIDPCHSQSQNESAVWLDLVLTRFTFCGFTFCGLIGGLAAAHLCDSQSQNERAKPFKWNLEIVRT